MIEAKIVEATNDFAEDLGIQWGINYISPGRNQYYVSGQPITGGSSSGSSNTFPGATNTVGNPFSINLPAAIGQGSGGAIGFGYISRALNLSLDLQLSALE
jgi:type IV pilus assembly protein PilQ